MIQSTGGKLHWNYFIALERDLETVSRYIEFTQQNFGVFSIELAHLLFAAASEVDVVAKLICEHVAPEARRANIDHYRTVITEAFPLTASTLVTVARYGLVLTPWDNWAKGQNPDWWRSYNNVKHERSAYFHEATLKNALNALAALLALTFRYYSLVHGINGKPLNPRDTTQLLVPESSLLRLQEDHYYYHIVG